MDLGMLTLWLVPALHGGLTFAPFISSVAMVVEYIYNEYIHDYGMS